MKARFTFLCAALLLSFPLFAREKTDVLLMRNGDRITCEIKALDSGTLYIKVSYILTTLSVNWAEVDHLESNQLFMIKTQDGLVYSGTLSTPGSPGARPAKLEIIESPSVKTTLDRGQIIQMNETSEHFWERFNGDIGMGFTYTKGNQSAQYNIGSSVAYPRERWSTSARFNSNLTSNSGNTPSTRNELAFSGQHLLPWNNWFYAGFASFLQSSEQGIDRQSTFGGGIGRYIKNTSHATITLTGGLAWQQINYQQSIYPVPSEQVTSALVVGDVRLFYFDRTTLDIASTVLPALSDPGRVHVNFNTTYYVKLWKNLKWNISFYGNWDNRPPLGFSGSDYGSSSGVSWTFGNR